MRTGLVIIALALSATVLVGCPEHQMAVHPDEAGEQYVYTAQGDEDDFQDVAERVYGDRDMWTYVADANPDVDPDEMEAGDELIIPAVLSEEGDLITPAGCERRAIY